MNDVRGYFILLLVVVVLSFLPFFFLYIFFFVLFKKVSLIITINIIIGNNKIFQFFCKHICIRSNIIVMLIFSNIIQSSCNSTLLQMWMTKVQTNEKLHKSQCMWNINSLENELDETIWYIVCGMVVISSSASWFRTSCLG
jgi:hypothetical protein